MLHQSTEQFQTSKPSRVAHLAAEYDRWSALYNHIVNIEDQWHELDLREKAKDGIEHAVRGMHTALDEIMITPAQSLHDFGLKARIVREFQHDDWYCSTLAKDLGRGELLARAMMVELLAINGLTPIPKLDFSPSECFEGYVEPQVKPVPVVPVTKVITFPTSSEPTTAPCRVGEMGRRFQTAVDQFNALDERESGGFNETGLKTRNESARKTAYMAITTLQDAASLEEATSADGALFQINIVFGLAERISANGGGKDCEGDLKQLDMALWSVRQFIERSFGVRGDVVGGRHCMGRDPRQIFAEAVAEAQPSATEFRQAAE